MQEVSDHPITNVVPTEGRYYLPPQIRKNGRAGIEASANMASLEAADRGLVQLTRFLNARLF